MEMDTSAQRVAVLARRIVHGLVPINWFHSENRSRTRLEHLVSRRDTSFDKTGVW